MELFVFKIAGVFINRELWRKNCGNFLDYACPIAGSTESKLESFLKLFFRAKNYLYNYDPYQSLWATSNT
jgi:hypothetical protein